MILYIFLYLLDLYAHPLAGTSFDYHGSIHSLDKDIEYHKYHKEEAMRSKLLTALTLGMMVLMVIGCGGDDKKDNEDNSNPLGPGSSSTEGSLTMSVSGAITKNLDFTEASCILSTAENWINLNGTESSDSDSYTLMLEIATTSTGTYKINTLEEAGENEAFGMLTHVAIANQNMDSYNFISGSVTLTKVSSDIKGTFYGEAQSYTTGNSITITDGKFNLPKHDADE